MEYELRRSIERTLHDGVQQQLVGLGVKLQLAQRAAETDTAAVPALLDELLQDVHAALDDVRRLAWDVYPSLLLDRGLVAALRESVSVRVDADGVGRYPPDVEAAVYFSCIDVPDPTAIRLEDDGRELRFEVVTLAGGSICGAIPLT